MSWFQKLSARAKLILSFISVSMLLAGVCVFSLYELSGLNTSLQTLVGRDLQGVHGAYEASIGVAGIRKTLRDALLDTKSEAVHALKPVMAKEIGDIEAALKEVEPTLITADDKAAYAELAKGLPPFAAGSNEILDLIIQNKCAEGLAAFHELGPAANILTDNLRKLCDTKMALVHQTAENSERIYQSAWFMVVVAIIVGIVLSFTLGWIIARWFAKALIEVTMIADSVAVASQQLAAAVEELSSGAQEQASSLEETASSLEEITGTIQQNAANAQQANQLAGKARDVAEKGGEVVSRAVQGMGEINAASRKIADIITAIDEIAFQTNLLALNAAVEAARAGEQGRGFAVVAGEVRNLAQRSAGAAKEIKGLIQDSVTKVENGSKLVNQSGETLNEIVNSVKRVTDIVSEIAAASREQAGGIEQVNKAVSQMDTVTQSNASQTEELSGTAESLASQAAQLQDVVSQFNLVIKHATRAATMTRTVAPATAKRTMRKAAVANTRKKTPSQTKTAVDDIETRVEHELQLLGASASTNGYGPTGFDEF